MRKTLFLFVSILILAWVGAALAADTKEVALVLEKGVKGEAKGKLIINTANGTDLAIQATGLDPKGVYTMFFVNEKSKMFEGIGPAPHVLMVNEKGEAEFKGTMTKDIYKRFVAVGIYLNPGGKPIANPVGTPGRDELGRLMQQKEKPKMILRGKLR